MSDAIEEQVNLRFTPAEAGALAKLLKEDGYGFDGTGLKAWVMDQAIPKSPTANYARRFGRAVSEFAQENPEAIDTMKRSLVDLGMKAATKLAFGGGRKK